MKTIGLIIAYILSNVIITQSLDKLEEHAILSEANKTTTLFLIENLDHKIKSHYIDDYHLSLELITVIPEYVNP